MAVVDTNLAFGDADGLGPNHTLRWRQQMMAQNQVLTGTLARGQLVPPIKDDPTITVAVDANPVMADWTMGALEVVIQPAEAITIAAGDTISAVYYQGPDSSGTDYVLGSVQLEKTFTDDEAGTYYPGDTLAILPLPRGVKEWIYCQFAGTGGAAGKKIDGVLSNIPG